MKCSLCIWNSILWFKWIVICMNYTGGKSVTLFGWHNVALHWPASHIIIIYQATLPRMAQGPAREKIMASLSLVRFWCLFVSKKMPNIQTLLWCHKAWSYSLCWSATSTMSMIELCCITALFGIFLETNKHQNLSRLRHPVTHVTLAC